MVGTLTEDMGDWLSRDQVLALFGFCDRTLCNWIRNGELPRPKRMHGRKGYFPRSGIELALMRMEKHANGNIKGRKS